MQTKAMHQLWSEQAKMIKSQLSQIKKALKQPEKFKKEMSKVQKNRIAIPEIQDTLGLKFLEYAINMIPKSDIRQLKSLVTIYNQKLGGKIKLNFIRN